MVDRLAVHRAILPEVHLGIVLPITVLVHLDFLYGEQEPLPFEAAAHTEIVLQVAIVDEGQDVAVDRVLSERGLKVRRSAGGISPLDHFIHAPIVHTSSTRGWESKEGDKPADCD